MARQKGIIKIQGSLGDLSFYSSVFGDIVRRKGGASKEKIKRSPAFERLREHHTEFAGCAAAGKLFRQALLPFTRQAADHRLVWRVTQLMNRVKDQDDTSDRGQRQVAKGLMQTEGKDLLNGFELNSEATLRNILKLKVLYQAPVLRIKGLVPKRDLVAPKGATHVRLTGIRLCIDFEKHRSSLQTDQAELALDKQVTDLALSPADPGCTGTAILLLQICFFQETGGVLNPLKNKKANSLSIVTVS
jgi:hypothetical protein